MLTNQDPKYITWAAYLLRRLAIESDNKKRIGLIPGIFLKLLNLSHHQDDDVSTQTTRVLNHLLADIDNQDSVVALIKNFSQVNVFLKVLDIDLCLLFLEKCWQQKTDLFRNMDEQGYICLLQNLDNEKRPLVMSWISEQLAPPIINPAVVGAGFMPAPREVPRASNSQCCTEISCVIS